MTVSAAAICVVGAMVGGAWNAVSTRVLIEPGHLYPVGHLLDTHGTDEVRPVRVKPKSRLDRYGNEVEDAVGDYRLDRRGEMYELHSPDTALPQLGPPST